MQQLIKQLIIEGSDDVKTQTVINKYKALTRQAIGTWDVQEQRKMHDEKYRALKRLEQLI